MPSLLRVRLSLGLLGQSERLSEQEAIDRIVGMGLSEMDMLINDEKIVAFSRVVARRRVEKEAEVATDKLEELIPKQMIEVKIQARALGRIIAARRKSAMRKDVTDYLYGGDITRKMKLREKQKKGKKKMQARGTVQIPQEAYLKMSKI